MSAAAHLLVTVARTYCEVLIVSRLLDDIEPPDTSPLIASASQIIALLGELITTMLNTLDFILLVNQRLNSESREVKDHFEAIFSTCPDASLVNRVQDGLIINCNAGF